MSRCTEQKLGDMLHAYELNQLDPNSREQFEIHLLECEHCFNEVAEFENIATIMTHDSEVKETIATELATDSEISKISIWQRVWQLLWPETSFVLKPIVVYFVVVLMVYPAYLGIRGTTDNNIRQVVTLNLVPNRSSSAIAVQSGNDILLTFVFSGAVPGKPYSIEMKSSGGEVIYRYDQYKGFDKYGLGRLIIPEEKISRGEYTLIIRDLNLGSNIPAQSYNFKIE